MGPRVREPEPTIVNQHLNGHFLVHDDLGKFANRFQRGEIESVDFRRPGSGLTARLKLGQFVL